MNSLTKGLVHLTKANTPLLRNTNVKPQHFQVSVASYSGEAYAKYVASLAAMGAMQTYTKLSNWISGKKPRPLKEQPKDTVILYQFPRAYNTPSLSPFAMKLETWLRAAGIKYQNQFSMQRGGKGLIPFIKLNETFVDDSQRCIEYLSQIFEADLNAHLTKEERAISHLVIKLTDDSLLWSMACFRFMHNPNGARDNMLPLLAYWNFAYRVGNSAKAARYGLLSKQELFDNVKKDLDSLETLIGEKKFLFSNETPCEADFALFGTSSQLIFNDTHIVNKYLTDNCPGILRHNEAMKTAYWPDWDTQIRKKTVPALKKSAEK